MEYNIHTLHNGLRIIHLPEHTDVVYCGYALKAGTRDEQAGEEGLAHFCEHMTFKGTAVLTPMAVINALERYGGELNAYTAKEETVYYAAILKQYFMRAVDVLTDMVFHSEYPQKEIDKEVEVVCDEIESYRDSPAELIYDEFENELFAQQDLGHNVLGTPEHVRGYATADCRAFTQRLYKPERAVFYVTGDIDFSRLVKRLERLFAGTAGASTATAGNVVPLPDIASAEALPLLATKSKTVRQDTHQAHVMMGTAIRGDIEQWRTPLFLANNLLGGPSMNSRLNISLRERRGLVYSAEGMMTTYTDTLVWSVYFGCDHSDASRCIRLVNSELRRLRRAPLSVAALEAAKRQIKGQIALASQNRENFAIDMAKLFLHYGRKKDTSLLYQRIDAVQPEMIHRLFNEEINDDKLFTLKFV